MERNIETDSYYENVGTLNVTLSVEKLPPIASSNLSEMDKFISINKLKALESDIKTASHNLIAQIAVAKEFANEVSAKTVEEQLLISLGLMSFSIGDYDGSIKFHEQASSIRGFEGDFPRIISNVCCIVSCLLLKGDVDKALSKYEESIELIKQKKEKK